MAEQKLFDKYGLTADDEKILFSEGEVGDTMYIIQDGCVRISKKIAGKEHTLAILGKGDFFGEMAIVSRMTRTATATAVGTVQLLVFDRQGFVGMIEKNAKIALNIIDKLCRRLQHANTQIQHLVKQNETGLIALNLQYAFAGQGSFAELEYHKLTREMAINMGIPLENLVKQLEKLQDKGVLKIEDNTIRLVDPDTLGILAEQ
jgi:CRP/FNR family cyclic AMP-dependent transcriptional regulator